MKFKLLSNKEGYTEIIKFKSQDGESLEYADESLKNDPDIIKAAKK